MVDGYAEEDKPDKEALEQCPPTLSLLNRDALISFSDMDALFAVTSEGAGFRTRQERQPINRSRLQLQDGRHRGLHSPC